MKVSRSKSGKSNVILIPIILALGFIPLIVHMYHYDVGWEDLAWFPSNSNSQTEFFLGWKAIAVVAVAVIMIGILLYQCYSKKLVLRTEPAFALLLIYGLFVLMAALFSPYKPQVFTGSYEVLQPLGVVLGYLVLCFYTYQFADDEKSIAFILHISGIGLGIMLTIGIFQLAGFDLLNTTVGHFLIANFDWWDKLDQISFTFPKHTVYATLYNPDFLSFYFGLIIPVIAALFFCVKKPAQKIILGIFAVLSVACGIGAGAASGYLAVLITAVVGIYILLSRNRKTWIVGNVAAGAALVILVVLCISTPLGSKLENLFLGTQRASELHAIKSIETTDENISFDINGQKLNISYTFDSDTELITIFFVDEEGNSLPSEIVNSDNTYAYELSDSIFGSCRVEPVYIEDTLCIRVTLDGCDWYFTNQIDGTYYYYNPIGKYEKISPVEKSSFFRDDAFSGRGNLWNLIIPQLSKHILIGSGANSFARVFPQNDYVYKVYSGLNNVFAVKAHNWFLQEWIENGLIGTLCLFSFYLWYMLRSIRIYHKCDLHSQTACIGMGIFVGTVGYMAAGVANDANVATAPVFWVIMGLGMAVNRMIVEKEELFPKPVAAEKTVALSAPQDSNTAAPPRKKSGKKMSKRERMAAKKSM